MTSMSSSAYPPDLELFLRGRGAGTGTGYFRFFTLPAYPRLNLALGKLGITRRCRLFIIKVLQRAALQLFAEDALDTAHHGPVFAGNESEGIARLLGPAGTADPVSVRVGGIGHIIVDDVGDA